MLIESESGGKRGELNKSDPISNLSSSAFARFGMKLLTLIECCLPASAGKEG